jgi:hypothetical protein
MFNIAVEIEINMFIPLAPNGCKGHQQDQIVARAINTINTKWSHEHQWQVVFRVCVDLVPLTLPLQIIGIHNIQY